MPRVSLYLSDEMYARARAQGVSLSAVTQAALDAQLATGDRSVGRGRGVDTGALTSSTTLTPLYTDRRLARAVDVGEVRCPGE